MYTKEQRNEYQKKYRKTIRNKIEKKAGGVCMKCGSVSNLEFDHRDKKTKKHALSTLIANGVNIKILMLELQKCDLLCRKCHVEKSKEFRDYDSAAGIPWNKGRMKHGSTGYNYGCRCIECKTWKRQSRKKKLIK